MMRAGEIYFNAEQTNIKRRTYLCDLEGLPLSPLGIDLDVTGHNRQAKYELLGLMPEDGGHRKFVMVELPENLDDSLVHAANDKKRVLKNAISLCEKNGVPHLLSEIAKERIRRAGDKIKAENPDTTQNLDIGFRVLKLDDSNIKEDRTDLDLLFGC